MATKLGLEGVFWTQVWLYYKNIIGIISISWKFSKILKKYGSVFLFENGYVKSSFQGYLQSYFDKNMRKLNYIKCN